VSHPPVFLLCTDDATRDSLRFLLGIFGWRVSEIFRPENLLSAIQDMRSGCVLLDEISAGGPELSLVHELLRRCRLPVLVLFEQERTRWRAARLGAVAVDALSGEILIQAISKALKSDSAGQERWAPGWHDPV
jgi:FixJ family two-component response regulator